MISQHIGSYSVAGGSSSGEGNRNNEHNGFLDTTKANPLSLSRPQMGRTIPPQRVTASSFSMPRLHNLNSIHEGISQNYNNSLISSLNLGDGPLPLSVLIDAAMGTASVAMRKRSIDESSSQLTASKSSSISSRNYKKQKISTDAITLNNNYYSNSNSLLLNGSNPVLMQRLSALGGGFPMPKFDGGNRFGRLEQQEDSSKSPQKHQLIILSSKIGAFPMPSLKMKRTLESFAPSLDAYKQVWDKECGERGNFVDAKSVDTPRKGSLEYQKELFSRRLQAGTVKTLGRQHKMRHV